VSRINWSRHLQEVVPIFFDWTNVGEYHASVGSFWSIAMPINAKCSCGREVNAPDAMAGKTVKCPQCKGALKIPGGSAAEDDIPVILLKKNRENSGSVKAAKPKRSRKSNNSGAII
jgi:hypothetical protein